MNAPEPAAAETLLDRWFYRPVSQIVSTVARATHLPAHGLRALALIVGLSGASLLRYHLGGLLIAAAVLLVLYGVLDAAASDLDRAHDTASPVGPAADRMSHLLVGLVSMIAVVDGDRRAALPVVLGFGAAAIQLMLADHFTHHALARSTPGGGVDRLAETEAEIEGGSGVASILLRAEALALRAERAMGKHEDREIPTADTAAAHARALGPIASAWAWLGHSTHVTLLALVAACGFPAVYAWIRLTLGMVALGALFAVQILRERELDPAAPAVQLPAAPASGAPVAQPAQPAQPAAEEPVKEHERGPISWRPPPMGE